MDDRVSVASIHDLKYMSGYQNMKHYTCICKKERQTSMPILSQSHFKNTPYMGFNLLTLPKTMATGKHKNAETEMGGDA